jgi:hypothetical protein
LREQEIATGDFFGDQTERELAFWQSKVGLTRKGTREWLDVQGHIFDASRTLARQAYQDHLADLNLQIEADRNSWSKTQADWQEKLAFIRSKFGEQSAEYRNAAREWTRAQTQHDDQEIQQAQLHAQRMVDSLRRDLDAQAKLRDDDARAQETMLRANAGNSPTGDITAAARIAQLHQQLSQQQLADTETLYSAQSAALDAALTKAIARYGEDQANYQSLLDAKLQADQQYAAQKSQIESQARLQSIQDILAVRSSYRSYIDGTVNASVTAFDGLISGQKTWGQAAGGIYQSVVRQAEAQFTRMAANWIVNHVMMTAAQRTQLALQSAAQATGEAAKTGAVVAGTAARTATTATGAAAAATITGTHNAKEIISHAATAAAAAYHAMSGIPVIGPVLGAAAAVATFSAVSAFGALASFDKGTNVLPNDMIAQVHAGERIVPAADNAKLLELTARGAGGAAGAASKEGDLHLHYQPTINGQLSFGDQLSDHESNIIAMLRRAKRAARSDRAQPMPLPVYPGTHLLPGLTYSSKWTPTYFNQSATAASGAEVDVGIALHPIHQFELTYAFLRDGVGWGNALSALEFRTLMGFHQMMGGSRGRCLYRNPDDYRVWQNLIGMGDGTTTTFTITRTLGANGYAASEPVGQVDIAAGVNVYLAGSGTPLAPALYTIDASSPVANTITFTTAPPTGAEIRMDMQFYYYCKLPDAGTFEKFMSRVWEIGTVKLRSCRAGT